MGQRYVDVPAERMFGELRAIGEAVASVGGMVHETVMGRERVVEFWPERSLGFVRVFTSVAEGARAARACDEDAVRIFVLVNCDDFGTRQVLPYDRLLRTAPKDGDRVAAFLGRLRTRVRVAVGHAMDVPACPACRLPMVYRANYAKQTFWGCPAFPRCHGSRSVKPPRDARGHRPQPGEALQ